VAEITSLIVAAFAKAARRQPVLPQTWVRLSHAVGSLLPGSTLVVSIQRAGRLDVLLRCMEEDFSDRTPKDEHTDLLGFDYQIMFSEAWVGSVYEITRLILDRKLVGGGAALTALAHDLRLLRITLEKHEIAADRRLTAPLEMERRPATGTPRDGYTYRREDPKRAHIMPTGVSPTGSVMWHVIDLHADSSRWIERRDLSDRFVQLWSN
jgi:hypothetical protein